MSFGDEIQMTFATARNADEFHAMVVGGAEDSNYR